MLDTIARSFWNSAWCDVSVYSTRELENGVKDFYELDDWKQCELLFELIERMAAHGLGSLEKLSKKESKAPELIWAEICVARGIDVCSIPERLLSAGKV
jgi:hypothetical protein